jgi:XTP/dITP diphosphohydrolase
MTELPTVGAVIVLSTRLGAVLPAAAVPVLRAAHEVLADPSVQDAVVAAVGARRVDGPDSGSADDVLLTVDPRVAARADRAVVTTEPAGAALLDAVAVMDRLRSPGGCPWDAEQTHRSLLPYLVEECYELYQAIEDDDPDALREELGDVLLQVLFHARVAAEDPGHRFTADDVADDLVAKLVGRHPHVFAGTERVASAADQEHRWEELKRSEKQRRSNVDGVPLAQPAAALAGKLVSRARRAGWPEDLLPDGAAVGDRLFALVAAGRLAGEDPEGELRAAARRFAADLRAAEDAARAAGEDPHGLDAAGWRRFWPRSAARNLG